MYDAMFTMLWMLLPVGAYWFWDLTSGMICASLVWVLLNIIPRFFGYYPMSGKDSLFMLDTKTNKLLVTSIAVFKSKISVKKYRSCIGKAIDADPKVKRYAVKLFGRHYWKDDENFNQGRHIKVISKPVNRSNFERYVNEVLTRDMKNDRPPYEIYFFKKYEGKKTAVIFKFHHCLADGLAMVSMTTWCADEGSCKIFYSPSEAPLFTKCLLYILSSFVFLLYTIKLLAQKRDVNVLHSQKLSGEKFMTWSEPIQMTEIIQYCKKKKVTFNDFLTAAVLKGLEDYAGEKLGTITATIPFSLRGQPKDGSFMKLENDLTIFPIEFPEVTDKIVEDCAKLYKGLKKSIKPYVIYLTTRINLLLFPICVVKYLTFWAVNKATLLFSNVGGPKDKVFYAGVEFESLFSMSPNMARCGISVTSFSYIDKVTITIYADKNLMPYPKKFIECVENAIKKLMKPQKMSSLD